MAVGCQFHARRCNGQRRRCALRCVVVRQFRLHLIGQHTGIDDARHCRAVFAPGLAVLTQHTVCDCRAFQGVYCRTFQCLSVIGLAVALRADCHRRVADREAAAVDRGHHVVVRGVPGLVQRYARHTRGVRAGSRFSTCCLYAVREAQAFHAARVAFNRLLGSVIGERFVAVGCQFHARRCNGQRAISNCFVIFRISCLYFIGNYSNICNARYITCPGFSAISAVLNGGSVCYRRSCSAIVGLSVIFSIIIYCCQAQIRFRSLDKMSNILSGCPDCTRIRIIVNLRSNMCVGGRCVSTKIIFFFSDLDSPV